MSRRTFLPGVHLVDEMVFRERHMFDEIASLAQAAGCKMTAYVDDVTISGTAATKELLGSVRQVIARHGLLTKDKKSKTTPPARPRW